MEPTGHIQECDASTDNRTPLSTVVRVRSGLPNRLFTANVPDGSHRLIQVGDYDEPSNTLSSFSPTRFHPKTSIDKHLLKDADVLFLAKGKRWLCFHPGQCLEPTVAADSFYVLSPGHDILPEFLVWMLNLPSSRKELSRDAGGSRNPIIRTDAIASFPILVPSIPRQMQLLHLDQLQRKEEKVLNRLIHSRKQLTQSIYTTLAHQQDPSA